MSEALASPDGCAIAPKNLSLLCDADANRAAVLDAIANVSASCGSDDILIIYFSGHGERENGQFFLLPHDAQPTALSVTAIRLEDLQLALKECKARGILFILDCCKSAGFAENADSFFRTLASSEFRLLLSASREGQASYEFDTSKGTYFTNALLDVLTGKRVIGQRKGVVYFSDLYEYVQERVPEALEESGNSPTLQEPVFAGVYTKDPRLFILNRLSLERIEAETPRYSRKFLERRIRRSLIAVAAFFALTIACYYTYLDHSRYIWVEPEIVDGNNVDYLSIYAGDPKLNAGWLGFPRRIFTTDIAATALSDAVRPGVGTPIATRFDTDIEPHLYQALSKEWKIAALVWMDDHTHDPWALAKQVGKSDDIEVSGLTEAVQALTSISSRANEPDLEGLVFGETTDSSPHALKKITMLDPHRGIQVFHEGNDPDETSPLDDVRFTIAVLEGLPSNCDPTILDFLNTTSVNADDSNQMHNAWYGALFRTGCVLPTATYFHKLNSRNNDYLNRKRDWIGGLLNSNRADIGSILDSDVERLISNLSQPQEQSDPDHNELGYNDTLRLWADIEAVIELCPERIPENVGKLVTFPYPLLAIAGTRALVVHDPRNLPLLVANQSSNPWVLSSLIEFGWFDESVVEKAILSLAIHANKTNRKDAFESGDASDAVNYMMRAIRLNHQRAALKFVKKVLVVFREPSVQVEAARTWYALISRAKKRDVSFPSANAHYHNRVSGGTVRLADLPAGAFLDDSMWWFIRHDSLAFSAFMQTLGSDEGDAANALGRIPLPDSILSNLRADLMSSDKRLRAVTVLAMRGTPADLVALLTSPDYSIRNQAMDYAAYNDALPGVIASGVLKRFGTQTQLYLRQQLLIRDKLVRRLNHLPNVDAAILIGLLRDENSDSSSGVMYIAQDAIDSLVGGTSYIRQVTDTNLIR